MLHIIYGGAGSGKSTRLMQSIDQAVTQGEKVYVLVPEQFSYEFDKKLYQTIGAEKFNQLESHSFKSLARAIAQELGYDTSGRTAATPMEKSALIYATIQRVGQEEQKLSYYKKQSEKSSFSENLMKIFTQFRRNGMAPEQVFLYAQQFDGILHKKLTDLFYLYQEYDMLLEKNGLKDTETDLTEAAAAANGKDFFLGSVFFLDEFESFTQDQLELLELLISDCKDVYIALRTDNYKGNQFSLFAPVNQTHQQLLQMATKYNIEAKNDPCKQLYRFESEDLAHLSQNVFRPIKAEKIPAQHIHIVEHRSPLEESEYICAQIRRLLAERPKLRLNDIAVLTNDLDSYVSPLENAMKRYDLTYFLDRDNPVIHNPFLLYLRTLLELARRRDLNTELLLRYAKTGLAGCSLQETSILENYVYEWSIQGDTWESPFTTKHAEQVEQIRQKLVEPIQSLRNKCLKTDNGANYCSMLYDFLEEQDITNRMAVLLQENDSDKDDQTQLQQQQQWNSLWKVFVDILDCMYKLYGTEEFAYKDFCYILLALTNNIALKTPPLKLDAILISQGTFARLSDPKIVFLAGVTDGTFPMSASNHALFSQKDCETMKDTKLAGTEQSLSLMQSKIEQLANSRLAAYKLLSAPSQELYLTYPVMNMEQSRMYPAPVLRQIQEMFSNQEDLFENGEKIPVSFFATTPNAAFYQHMRHHSEHTTDTASVEASLERHPLYIGKLRWLADLSKKYARKEGEAIFYLDQPNRMEEYYSNGLSLSASSVERFYKCPFQYFCQDILRLKVILPREVIGLESGSMIHDCLENILKNHTKEEFLALTEGEFLQESTKYAMAYWENQMGGDFSKTQRDMAKFQKLMDHMQKMLQHLQMELKESTFYPAYFELEINDQNPDFPTLKLETPAQHKLQFKGKIDRVDTCEVGGKQWVRVIDYKTGHRKFHLGSLLYGIDMQMPLYLFTITSEGYKLGDATPAGVLYLPAGNVPHDRKRQESQKKTLEDHVNDTYSMNGFILNDVSLYHRMDPEGKFTEFKITKTNPDKVTGNALSSTQMQNLKKLILQNLTNMTDTVYQGKIDALPLKLKDLEVCKYCNFQDICGNSEEKHCNDTPKQHKENDADILKALEKEEE